MQAADIFVVVEMFGGEFNNVFVTTNEKEASEFIPENPFEDYALSVEHWRRGKKIGEKIRQMST